MKKSLHIIKGCFYKLTIIIISTDYSILYTNFGKVSCCSVLARETKTFKLSKLSQNGCWLFHSYSWGELGEVFSENKDIDPALVS